MNKVEKEELKKVKKEELKKVNKKINKGVSEFKEFIMRGDVVDLAVGVIIGGAFGKIVTSLVNDILMPIIGILIGGIDFSNLCLEFAETKIMYGSFMQQVIDFLIISVCIFTFIKIVGKFIKKKEDEVDKKVEEVKKSDEVILLEEIRDLLKERSKN